MSYIFKPRSSLTDSIRELCEEIKLHNPEMDYLTVSKLYEFGAQLVIKEYHANPGLITGMMKEYFEKTKIG